MNRTLRRPLLAVSVAAIAVLASACQGLSTPPAPGEAINTCVAAATGNVRFIDPANGTCERGETAMQLQQGGQGAPGVNGLNGTDGADGAPGAPGVNGAQGIQGVPGAQGIQGIPGEPGPGAIATSTPSATVPDGSAQTILELELPAGTDFYALSASAWTLTGLDPACTLAASADPYGDMALIDRAGYEISPSAVARTTTVVELTNPANRTVLLVCSGSGPGVSVRASLTATPLDHQ